jgi:tRNA (guanine26-N2/guanine27-N2)-dimethyltransferase
MASPKPAEAAAGVVIDGKRYRAVREGLASILAPYAEDKEPSGKHVRNNDEGSQAVFYNPIQQFNRDLSVLAIAVYGEGAVLEKEARLAQKAPRHGKKNKGKGKGKSDAMTSHAPSGEKSEVIATEQTTANSNGLKRKADELADDHDPNPAVDDSNKKTKIGGLDDDNEIELPVEALTSDPSDSQPANKDRPNGTSSHTTILPTTAAKRQTPFTILDALSATGLRALRYAKEIPLATNIVANDLSAASVQTIRQNIRHNEVGDRVHAHLGDARGFMYGKVGNERPPAQQGEAYVHRFDVIDLDPYGTAAPFFDASVQALQDGGLLCVTCTDAGVFASTGYPEKTYALYGGTPVKGPHSHEAGLRLILNGVAVSAARYGLAVEPLLSLYIDYYARLFVRVHRRPHEVKLLAGTTMAVYNCGHGCGAWTTQPLLRNLAQTAKNGETFFKLTSAQAPTTTPNCPHCGSKTHLCGPMWAGPLHNPHFVQRMLDRIPSLDKEVYQTTDRLQGMLTLALEEDLTLPPRQAAKTTKETEPATEPAAPTAPIPRLPPNTLDAAPFFVLPTQLARVIHCQTPGEDVMRGAILGLGYRVSRSHCKGGSIKTNAPWSVLWEIMREFVRTKSPIKEGAVKKGSPGYNILRRVRGTDRHLISQVKDNALSQVPKCETKQDLKTVLQGMLWRLDNETSTPPAAAAAADEKQETTRRSSSPTPPPSPSQLKIVFDEKLGREKRRDGKLVRYQMNPRENWGPMNRAGGQTTK